MKLISQPIDFYGQNIYRGDPVRMGQDGRPEFLKHPVGGPKTAIGWDVYKRQDMELALELDPSVYACNGQRLARLVDCLLYTSQQQTSNGSI